MSNGLHPIAQQSPVVIFGTGGSGTRVIEQFFEKSGYFMGNVMNEAKDAAHFHTFLANNIPPVMRRTHSTDYRVQDLPSPMAHKLISKLTGLVDEHASFIPDDAAGWGWKNPRFIYLLPLLHAVRNDAHFVHVIRDGRDMAYSENQNQLGNYYRLFFEVTSNLIPRDASIQMWQKVNLGAAAFAKRVGCKYTVIRYEDACLHPQEAFKPLHERFGIPVWDTSVLVKPSGSIGRYKKAQEHIREKLEKTGQEALAFFGYS